MVSSESSRKKGSLSVAVAVRGLVSTAISVWAFVCGSGCVVVLVGRRCRFLLLLLIHAKSHLHEPDFSAFLSFLVSLFSAVRNGQDERGPLVVVG